VSLAVGAGLVSPPELCVHLVGICRARLSPSRDVAPPAHVATWAVGVHFAVALFNLVGVQLSGHLTVVIEMYLYLCHTQNDVEKLLPPW